MSKTEKRRYLRPIRISSEVELRLESLAKIDAQTDALLLTLKTSCGGILASVRSDVTFESVRSIWLETFCQCAELAGVEVQTIQRYGRSPKVDRQWFCRGLSLPASETGNSFDVAYLNQLFEEACAKGIVDVIDWLSRENACPVCGDPLDGKNAARYCGTACSSYAYRQRRSEFCSPGCSKYAYRKKRNGVIDENATGSR